MSRSIAPCSERPWMRVRSATSSARRVGFEGEPVYRDPGIPTEYGLPRTKRLLNLAALATLVACGGHTDAEQAPPTSALLASFCAQLAQEYCTMNHNCCGSSDASCQSKLEAQFNAESARDLGPNVEFDSAATEGCLSVVRKVAAACSYDSLTAEDYLNQRSCSFPLRGLVPQGGICTGAECLQTGDSLAYCDLTDGVGRCASTPLVGLGGDCSNAACAPELYCDHSTSIPTCQSRKPAGAPCSGLLECWPPSCTNGVCTPMTMTEGCEGLASRLRGS
jgi:hypothetical protein